MRRYIKRADIDNTRDKLASGPVTTGDYAISSSSNMTVDSDGAYDDSGSLFPHNKLETGKNKSPKDADNFAEGRVL